MKFAIFILLLPVAIAARHLPVWFLGEIVFVALCSYLWRIHYELHT